MFSFLKRSFGVKAPTQYVDWSKVPEGYDWACLGDPEHFIGEGYLRIYKFKPEIKMYSVFEDWGCIDEGAIRFLPTLAVPLPPWRESLRQRPKE